MHQGVILNILKSTWQQSHNDNWAATSLQQLRGNNISFRINSGQCSNRISTTSGQNQQNNWTTTSAYNARVAAREATKRHNDNSWVNDIRSGIRISQLSSGIATTNNYDNNDEKRKFCQQSSQQEYGQQRPEQPDLTTRERTTRRSTSRMPSTSSKTWGKINIISDDNFDK